MNGLKRSTLVRDFDAGEHLDLFLVTAVAAVMFIRIFLKVTGFPRLGGDTLHVAHMLWGGILMLVAIIVLISFLGSGSRKIAAVLGGAGFGAFIDEVGKFVTHDNDYFFRPSLAIIYTVFILTYLAIRSLHRDGRATRTEFVVNALREAEQIAIGDLDHEERDRALGYLEKCNPNDALVVQLREMLQSSETVAPPDPGLLVRAKHALIRFYRRLSQWPWFGRAVVVFFAGRLVFEAVHAVNLIVFRRSWVQVFSGGRQIETLGNGSTRITFFDGSMALFSVLEAVLVALGVWYIRRSPRRAYEMFQRSILVSIFFIQPLLFYRDQWGALLGLVVNLLVFAALRFMIERERPPLRP